eukprot:CAMPEP_0176067706 /NCGR_PEP_ID=MMETSP0120_2-20121206/33798_1 /TAXON_ID=160619 /ORGANISM="Kryptoperidinium foliaceum, Strain CCMP 1326" /LENGTH=324 /DNA_ID=CAMNT_0017401329 /DNA_START=50 /DNA_END=1024 /DNA_ORIENTATION=+
MPCVATSPFAMDDDLRRAREKRVEVEDDDRTDAGDETTPTTIVSEPSPDDQWESEVLDLEGGVDEEHRGQLGPGLFHGQDPDGCRADEEVPLPIETIPEESVTVRADATGEPEAGNGAGFTEDETLFIFDWDDTILPSSWLQRQGLRLDAACGVSESQRELLASVAAAAMETLILAKHSGTVVLVTNAERGWIELSCRKFVPALLPIIENIRIVSARTSYERSAGSSPHRWKALAFKAEISRACGADALVDPTRRKNILSLGDGMHEREALLRATAELPNCCSKSLKFVDRPDIGQLLAQHALVTQAFDNIVQLDGDLDLSINC